MQYLFKGMQSQDRFNLLIGLTKISSDDIKSALCDYLVKGMDKKAAAALNGVKPPNFSVALAKLEEKSVIVENIIEIEWYTRKSEMKLDLVKERINSLVYELKSLISNPVYSDEDIENNSQRIYKRLELEIEHIGTSKRNIENEHCYLEPIYSEVLTSLSKKDTDITLNIEDGIERCNYWLSNINS